MLSNAANSSTADAWKWIKKWYENTPYADFILFVTHNQGVTPRCISHEYNAVFVMQLFCKY